VKQGLNPRRTGPKTYPSISAPTRKEQRPASSAYFIIVCLVDDCADDAAAAAPGGFCGVRKCRDQRGSTPQQSPWQIPVPACAPEVRQQ
jgi:hypothetical protein